MAAVQDYVVVGAGSAGCVLAARLTEAGARVLLLEAGGSDRHSKIRMPAAFSRLYKTDVDWNYQTEEEPALGGRTLYWPRGKMLGGCSSINAMIYIRGHRSDYDSWASQGNEGWSFAEVLPYFRRAENQERGGDTYHGTGGPLNVADLRCRNPLSAVFLEACSQVGIPRNDDFNGSEQDGAGYYQVNQRGGQRCSAVDAYLHAARRRRTLTVLTNAQAMRVLFEGNRAVGVEYQRDGVTAQVRATQEVILCGGAVNSPQLLLLSGVGPAAELKRWNLPLVADLPGVGHNLQDHPVVALAHVCTRPITLDQAATLVNFVRYFFRRGPLTSNLAEAGAFVRTAAALAVPNLQVYFGPVYFLEHGFHQPPGHGFTLGACLLRPVSRGRVALRSRDPLQPPAIRPGYLEAPDDCRTLAEGLRLLRRIAAATAFAPFRGPEYRPGERVRTEEEVERYVRGSVETLYHPVGTCRMGTDASSVVSPRLEVHGTTGLRVVDASVMPTLIGGNTHAPVVMIAEKAADLILGLVAAGEGRVVKVSLLVTCLGDALFPEVGVATVRLLRRLGVSVDFPPSQTCCGQPHFNSGYQADARELAQHTIKAFVGSEMVVAPSGSCAAMVKREYPELFHDDPVWQRRAQDLAARTQELSGFLVNVLGLEDVGARFPARVTYHMACHLRGLNLLTEPERLLRRVRDLEYIPLERADECCGFGGSFSVRYPGISGAMVNDKADFIQKTGVTAVVATDAGCLMNIGGCLRRRGSAVRTLHLAQVLENT